MTRRIIAIVAIVLAVGVLALAVGLAVHGREHAHAVRGFGGPGMMYGYGERGGPMMGDGSGQYGAPSGDGSGRYGMPYGNGDRQGTMPHAGTPYRFAERHTPFGAGLVVLALFALLALALAVITLTGYLHWGKPQPVAAAVPAAAGGALPPVTDAQLRFDELHRTAHEAPVSDDTGAATAPQMSEPSSEGPSES